MLLTSIDFLLILHDQKWLNCKSNLEKQIVFGVGGLGLAGGEKFDTLVLDAKDKRKYMVAFRTTSYDLALLSPGEGSEQPKAASIFK